MAKATNTNPHDEAAEAALVSAGLHYPDRLEAVADDVAPEDFYVLAHRKLWAAVLDLIAEGVDPDPVVLADRSGVAGDTILGLIADALPPQRAHAEIVLRHAASRRLLVALAEARGRLDEGVDPFEVAGATAGLLDRLGDMAGGDRPEGVPFGTFVEQEDFDAPWMIPDLVRAESRVLLVAAEGVGKSVLFRQIAECSAQGIHPLTHKAMTPVRVLLVDLENPAAAIRETGRVISRQARRVAGASYDASRCVLWRRPAGIDLRSQRDRAAFVRELRAARPDLVCIGPLYKTGATRRLPGEAHEDAAEAIQHVLDDLRVRFGFALILEHHAPKGQGGYRDLVPFGSQRWQAWPELGITLRPERDGSGLRVGRFRGDRLRTGWPTRLVRGDVWPWSGVWLEGMPGGGGDNADRVLRAL